MDTKLRNIRYYSGFKLLAVFLCVLGAVAAAIGALRAWDFPMGLAGKDALALHSLWWFLGGLMIVLLSLAWLAYTAGRSVRREGVTLLGIDRVYVDVSLFLVCFACGFCGYLLYQLLSGLHFGTLQRSYLVYAGGASLSACIALLFCFLVTSLSRRIKRRELLKHTLIFVLIPRICRSVRKAWVQSPLAVRWSFLLLAYAVLSGLLLFAAGRVSADPDRLAPATSSGVHAFVLLMLYALVQVAALVYVARKARLLNGILSGVQKIRSGEFTHRMEPRGGSPFAEIVHAINNIAEGLNAALEDRVKAERMKAELVTNVSHDLRTPMTSIITYIDLLKAEIPGEGNAAQYISVLEAKAKRLRALSEDLFEAAKAASGSIKPAIMRLDVIELMSQGLGELADKIKESGLDFRVSLIGEKLYIQADGKLLWRVVENLLSNVFKYTLERSRVYVSAYRSRGLVRIEVKNVSAYEITIPAEELTERFTRGDKSRGSEGSGLGLAIAKSLTELQGGEFRIVVDGDLFKAIVEFKADA